MNSENMQKPNRKAPVPISLTDVSSFVFCSLGGFFASFLKILFWEPFVSVSSSDISDMTKAVLSLILPQTLIALNKRLIWELRLTKYLRVDIFKMSQIEDIHVLGYSHKELFSIFISMIYGYHGSL